jgi:putative tricarboxylic transport membrane protein
MGRRNLLSGVVWLGVGLFFCAGALRYKLMHLGAYGPGFYPFIMGCVLVALSAGLVILSYKTRNEDGAQAGSAPRGIRKIILVLIAVFGYGAALPFAGFLLTTFLLLVILLRYIEPVRWTVVIGMALVTTLASYALFVRWLGVQMPRGILYF